MSRLTQEKKKFEYRRATYKIRHRVFCPTSRSRQESKGFFYRRATYKGRKYKKPRKPLSPPGLVCRRKERKEKDQGRWSVATRRGCEKKKRKEKDQGRWSVATRRGRGKKKKRKEKDQGRREGGSPEGKVPCALNQEFLFWFTSIWVLRDLSCLKYRLLRDFSLRGSHVRRKFRKRTTLRSESSTFKGLLYAG
jgi:hypothetical protein